MGCPPTLRAQENGPPGQPRVVRQLKFEGNHAISDEILATVISTTKSSWFATSWLVRWMGIGEKRYFDEREFQADVLRLHVFYIRSGYPDAAIDTTVRRDPRDVYITFGIREGQPIRVDSLSVLGIDSFPPRIQRALTTDLPLRSGDVFDRYLMQADADTVTRRLKNHGYPGADVFTSFETSAAARTATVVLDALPGQRAAIGSIRFAGLDKVDTSTAAKFLSTHPGRPFSQEALYESQRNLYASDLFRFASVAIDTTKYRAGMDSVPLLVQVSEAKPYRVRAGLGYGTTDCFRGNGAWTARDLLGGGRVLDLSAQASKIGVGKPTSWGLRNGICSTAAQDSIGARLINYGFNAALRQPAFLSPQNTLTFSGFLERRSEYKVYLREDIGGSITLAHESVRRRIPISGTYTLSYGRTNATDASFCAFLQVCDRQSIDFLQERRRLATITLQGALPRVNNPTDPTRGMRASAEVTWASRLIGSSTPEQFTRLLADAAWYRPLSRSVVLSWHVRGGMIFAPRLVAGGGTGGTISGFVPPEERFYAGGPNDVRGYRRNELGPVVYVTTSHYYDSVSAAGAFSTDSVRVAATGANTLVVGNVELRLPSPVFSSRTRLAVFLDAGALWQRGTTGLSTRLLRVTPGAGIRVATPLGPVRFDLAYNPYRLQPGPLYVTDSTGALTLKRSGFTLSRGGHFTLHFAVGQPF